MKFILAAILLAPSLALAQAAHAPLPVTPLAGLTVTGSPLDPVVNTQEIFDNDAESDGVELRLTKYLTNHVAILGSATKGVISTDPNWRWRAGGAWSPLSRLSLSASVEHVDSRSGIDDDGDRVTSAPYTVINAKATVAVIPDRLFVSVIGYNLANKPYFDGPADASDAVGNGRTVRFLVSAVLGPGWGF